MRTTYRLSWRQWVTPKLLKNQPRHRWFVFPHSFSSELVHALISEWELGRNDYILDPFVGAGTTTLSARELGVPAKGYDLSPMAVLAARVKIADHDIDQLQTARSCLVRLMEREQWEMGPRTYRELVQNALPGNLLLAFDTAMRNIAHLALSPSSRDFFQLALLGIIPYYSRAVATGGWLEWVNKRTQTRSIPAVLGKRVDMMLEDLQLVPLPRDGSWQVAGADARNLPDAGNTYAAVITSPPYPNRHDYTRVFGIELMFAFLDWEGTRRLRYQSFQSHPEAQPERPTHMDYQVPAQLRQVLARIRAAGMEPRILRMLEGYFLDMYLSLCEVARVCRPGARIAFVVGNTQYAGQSIPVDRLTAQVGEQAGLRCERIVVARYRGNSPQQMRAHGRRPSREGVVIFRKP